MVILKKIEAPLKNCFLLLIIVFISGCDNVRYLADRELVIDVELPKYHHSKLFICKIEESSNFSKAGQKAFAKAEENLYGDKSLNEKLDLYREAAEEGYDEALTRILQLYLAYNEIDRTEEDVKEGPYAEEIIYALQAMLNKKMPISYAYLAQFRRDGLFAFKNISIAKDLFFYASLLGNAKAQSALGDYYLYTEGQYQKGIAAHQCAMTQSYLPSYEATATAIKVFEKNYPRMLATHLDAANQGSLKSLRLLRSVFRDGLYGYEKDQDLSLCYHRFIEEYSSNPKRIHGLDTACPLPNHPELKDGLEPLKKSDKEHIQRVEKKFNPHRKHYEEAKLETKMNRNPTKKVEEIRKRKMRAKINKEISRF